MHFQEDHLKSKAAHGKTLRGLCFAVDHLLPKFAEGTSNHDFYHPRHLRAAVGLEQPEVSAQSVRTGILTTTQKLQGSKWIL